MEMIVEIDVSKDRLDVAILPQGEVFTVGNDHAGIDELVERIERHRCRCDCAWRRPGGFENAGGGRAIERPD